MSDLEARIEALEKRMGVIEHRVGETSAALAALQSQMTRLENAATSQGLALERVLRNTNRLIEIFEPTVIVEKEPRGG